MVLGQLALGIGSLILFFGSFGAVATVIGVVGIVLAGLALIVTGVWMVFKKKFEGIGLIIMGVGIILFLFIGWWALIPIAVGLAVFMIIKHWDKFKAFFITLWDTILKIYNSKIGWLLFPVIKVIEKIVRFFMWLYKKLVGGSIIPDMVREIIAWFWKLPGAIMKALVSILKKVFDWGVDFIKNMANGIRSMASKFKDALLSIFPSWARNAIWGGGKMVVKVISGAVSKVKSAVTGGRFNDFIWRPGQAPIDINPNDTLVGFKGAAPDLGGGGGGITQENHFHGFTMDDLKRDLDDRDRRLVDEVRRLVKT